jgi:hypothetical protein
MSNLKPAVLVTTLLLAACGIKGEAVKTPPPTVEEVLASSLAANDYGEPQRCLQTSEYIKIEVLDKKHLLFEGRGGKYWLNILRNECPGLRKGAVLQLDLTSSRVCNLDTVTAIETRRFYIDRISATCSLNEFVAIPKEQAEFLKTEIRGK